MAKSIESKEPGQEEQQPLKDLSIEELERRLGVLKSAVEHRKQEELSRDEDLDNDIKELEMELGSREQVEK